MSSLIRKATKYKEQAKFEVKALVAAEKYLEEEKQRLEYEQVALHREMQDCLAES